MGLLLMTKVGRPACGFQRRHELLAARGPAVRVSRLRRWQLSGGCSARCVVVVRAISRRLVLGREPAPVLVQASRVPRASSRDRQRRGSGSAAGSVTTRDRT